MGIDNFFNAYRRLKEEIFTFLNVNGLVQNWERSMSRLYTVTCLLNLYTEYIMQKCFFVQATWFMLNTCFSFGSLEFWYILGKGGL